MSGSEGQHPSSRRRWRAPAIGAVAGLAVAAAIVVPSAIAAGGQSAGSCAATKSTRAIASSRAPAGGGASPFIAAVARLEQAGTIDASQARVIDADIQSGSIDPDKLVADGVVTAAQMKAVNDRLVAIKMGIAAQVHASNTTSSSGPSKGGG
jgi:hypothetical protein